MYNTQWNTQANMMFDDGRQLPAANAIWPKNQTFRIQRELYTLLEQKGNGKFGSVWSSITSDGQRAAIKVFDLRGRKSNINQSTLLQSFQNETRIAHMLRHAKNHVVTIYAVDLDLQRGVALMAMELGDDSLKDRVQNLHQKRWSSPIGDSDYISAGDRKYLWIQLVDIVHALRYHNVIHRDLKPANLVFFGPLLKVVDLGIAQDASGYGDQIRINSPYSAPECLTGEAPVTTKADIWSIGAILYYLTYGRAPVQWSSQAPYGVPSTRSTQVQDVLNHCLQRNIHQRADHQWLSRHPLTNGTIAA